MTIQLKRLIAPLFLAGIVGGVSIQPALAAADGPSCHIEFSRGRRFGRVVTRATFFVRSPGRRGAVGVWNDGSGHRLAVRVEPGERKEQKTRGGVEKGDYALVRCETT